MSVVPAMMSEKLGCAQLTFASKVTVDPSAKKVSVTRVTEAGVDEVHGEFPCVISVVEKINEPRYPSFKGIMAAKKKTIDIRDFASTGAQFTKSWSAVIDAAPRPPRATGVVVTDDGSAGQKLVDFLCEKKLI
jgi:electron transfer flavoprotein beta subunit